MISLALFMDEILDISRIRSTMSFELMFSILSEGGTTAPSLRRKLHPFLLESVRFISLIVSLHLCNITQSRELIVWSAVSGFPYRQNRFRTVQYYVTSMISIPYESIMV